MAKYRWPTDPPGKPAAHSISWEQHQQNMAAKQAGSVFIDGKPVTQQQWESGALLNALVPQPVTAPQPFDPMLAAAQQSSTFNRGLADAEAAYQTGETAYSLGYNADGSLNTANPYSDAALLQNSYRRSVTGTNNSMASQGQLYSGARLNAQARNDRQYAEGSSALRDRARQTYHGIGFGQLQSYGASSLGLSQEAWDALRRSTYGS